LVAILEPLGDALDTVAGLYPTLQETADAVAELVLILDAIQVVTDAVEFGLKVECLDTLGKAATPLYLTVFPDSAGVVRGMAVSPDEHRFEHTAPGFTSDAIPLHILNTGNQTLSLSSVTLADMTNFALDLGTPPPTLAPHESFTVYAQFSPARRGRFFTTVTATTNAEDGESATASLSGWGVIGVLGDVNGDEVPNAIDVQIVINSALGIEMPFLSDIDGDDTCNALDVQLAVNAVLGWL
jgi:hypothetical protein